MAAVAGLLDDLGRDVRSAGAISGGGGHLSLTGAQAVSYESSQSETIRRVAGLPGEDRRYAATFQAQTAGRMVNLTAQNRCISLQTAIARRNR